MQAIVLQVKSAFWGTRLNLVLQVIAPQVRYTLLLFDIVYKTIYL